MALGLSMLPTVALSLPFFAPFLGRKRRGLSSRDPVDPTDPTDPATHISFNWTPAPRAAALETQVAPEAEEGDAPEGPGAAASRRCRQLDDFIDAIDTARASAVLFCPGATWRTVNMIRIYSTSDNQLFKPVKTDN